MNSYVVLFLVQLVGEVFPVSSSSHVRLVNKLLAHPLSETMMWSSGVDAVLHGCMLVVLALYFWRSWVWIAHAWIKEFLGALIFYNKRKLIGRIGVRMLRMALLLGVVLMLVTAWYFFGLPTLQQYGWFTSDWFLLGGLVCTMGALLSLRFISSRVPQLFGLKHAVVLSIVQMVALLPGVSRFATCYVAARWLGLREHKALRIAFLVEVPLIAGAFVVRGLPLLVRGGPIVPGLSLGIFLLVCCIGMAAALVGLLLVEYSVKYNYFWLFGLYMLVPISYVWFGLVH